MNINIKSSSDCRMLLDRIKRTLTATSFNISRIRSQPAPFCKDDRCIFKGLSEAVLSNRAVWSSVQPHLNTIGQALYAYNINKVASLSNGDLDKLYANRLKPLKVRSQRLRKRLEEIRDNASAFQDFTRKNGPIRNFILTYFNSGRIEDLRSQFIGKCAGFKLHGVGVAICSEFFNNIGIDEFKADSNITRFFERTGMAAQNASPDDIRTIGITIAENSEKPRVYVDSLMWCFCVEGEGGICTKNNPRCHLCKLNTEEPRLCTYCGSSTMLGAAGLSHKGTKSIDSAESIGVNKVTGTSQTDSNLLEKEVEMNLPPGTGIIVDGEIVDPKRLGSAKPDVYIRGPAKGLLRFEIGIVVSELRKMISAFPSHYTFPISPSPRKGKDPTCYVKITLVIGQSEYGGKLCVPTSRLQDLQLSKPLLREPQYREPWISASLKDKNGLDDKLVRALKLGGFVSKGPVKLRVLGSKIWILKP